MPKIFMSNLYTPVCTWSPICSSDIVIDFPFWSLTFAVDGKQPLLGGGGAAGVGSKKVIACYKSIFYFFCYTSDTMFGLFRINKYY